MLPGVEQPQQLANLHCPLLTRRCSFHHRRPHDLHRHLRNQQHLPYWHLQMHRKAVLAQAPWKGDG